jgi:valyl-tRNA synthetase
VERFRGSRRSSGAVHPGTGPAPAAAHPVNQWVIAGCHHMVAAVDKALAELRFDAAADACTSSPGRFCDWYVELAKPLLADDATRDETRSVLGWALDRLIGGRAPVHAVP